MKHKVKVQSELDNRIKNKHLCGINIIEINTEEYLKDFYQELLLNQEPLVKGEIK